MFLVAEYLIMDDNFEQQISVLLDNINKTQNGNYVIATNEDDIYLTNNKINDICLNKPKIFISAFEIVEMAEHLGMSAQKFVCDYFKIIIDKKTHLPRMALYNEGKCVFADKNNECKLHYTKPLSCSCKKAIIVDYIDKDMLKGKTLFIVDKSLKIPKENSILLKDLKETTEYKHHIFLNNVYNKMLTQILKLVDFEKLTNNEKLYDDMGHKEIHYAMNYFLYYIFDNYNLSYSNEKTNALVNEIINFYTRFVNEYSKYKIQGGELNE